MSKATSAMDRSRSSLERRGGLGLVLLLPALLVGLAAGTLAASRPGPAHPRPEYSTQESLQLTDYALALQREQADLKGELAGLRAQLDAIQEQAARTDTDARALRDRIQSLEDEAGLTPLGGEGFVVTLDDARLPPSRDPRLIAPAIIHSQDITDVFNAAWKGGARAIAVNGERITSASACVGATIQINGTLMSPPFVISIVGPRDRLARVLDDPAELADLRARQRGFGLRFDVAAEGAVRVPAYTGPLRVRYARSV